MRMRNKVRSQRFTTDGSLRKVMSLLHYIFLSTLLLLLPSPWVMVDALTVKNARSSLWRQRSEHSWFSSVPSRQKRDNALLSLTATQQPQQHQTNTMTYTTSTTTTTTLATSEEQQQQRPVPAWKQKLPEPLCSRPTLQQILIPTSSPSSSSSIVENNRAFVEIYLLGTSHVSSTSCQDVRLLLEHVQPDIIFVELCEDRAEIFDEYYRNSTTTITNDDDDQQTTTTPDDDSSLSFWEKVHLVQGQAQMSRVDAMLPVVLAQSQKDMADAFGVEVGGEVKVAYQYYLQQRQNQQELQQSQRRQPVWFILGDRPLYLTMRRCMQSFSWWGKFRFVMSLILYAICSDDTDELEEEMQNVLEPDGTDYLTEILMDVQESFPTLDKIITEERNAYMACKLCQTCQCFITEVQQQQQTIIVNLCKVPQRPSLSFHSPTTIDRNITVVAIVGAAHVQGMVEWFTNWKGQLPRQVLRELVETKKKRRWRWWTNRRRGMKAKLDQQDYDDKQRKRSLIEDVPMLQRYQSTRTNHNNDDDNDNNYINNCDNNDFNG